MKRNGQLTQHYSEMLVTTLNHDLPSWFNLDIVLGNHAFSPVLLCFEPVVVRMITQYLQNLRKEKINTLKDSSDYSWFNHPLMKLLFMAD